MVEICCIVVRASATVVWRTSAALLCTLLHYSVVDLYCSVVVALP